MAARPKPSQEFRFYNVERTKPGSTRIWVRHRCESINRCFSASVGGAESVSIGAFVLGAEPVRIHNATSVFYPESHSVHDAPLQFGRLTIESHWTFGQSTIIRELRPPFVARG